MSCTYAGNCSPTTLVEALPSTTTTTAAQEALALTGTTTNVLLALAAWLLLGGIFAVAVGKFIKAGQGPQD